MNRMRIVSVVVIVLLAITLVVVWLRARDERERLAKLEAARRDVCWGQRHDIEALLKRNVGEGAIHERVKFDITDMSVAKLCLGADLPVSFSDADMCWIASGGKGYAFACYEKPLRELLALYKQRF